MLLVPAYLVGFIAFVVVVVYGMAISRLMGVRVRRLRSVRSIRPPDMPAEIVSLLREHGRALEALGFEDCGAVEEDYLVDGVDEPAYSLLYCDANRIHIARITLAESPTRLQPVELSFYACALDGRLIETVAYRAHRLRPGLPDHEVVDAQTLEWDEQYERHRQAVRESHAFEPLRLDASLLVTHFERLREEALSFELSERRFLPKQDGTLRFSFRWAIRTVMRANGGERGRLRALAEYAKQSAVGADERSSSGVDRDLTPDLAAHRRRDAVEQSRRSGWARKLVYFTASVLLFVLAFGIQLTPRTVLLLLAVLFIHEVGHALAMRFFGYKDLQILFIPFLGAVASGRKENIAAWQEVVVLLAGPVPGIVIGTLVMATGWGVENDWIRNGAQFMLLLNYLNLLPIVPLDGGRIMSIVLFDRHPKVQFGFSMLSSLAIIGVGVALGEAPITCVGIVLLAGVPRQLDQVRTFAKVRGDLEAGVSEAGASPAQRLRSVYAELREKKFDRWNSETKYQFVRHILERLDRQTANLRVALTSFSVYCAVVALPLGLLVWTYVPEPGEQSVLAELPADARLDEQARALEGQIAAMEPHPEPMDAIIPVPEESSEAVE
ncbi:MAG: site-2 protease family protein [Deltaproteobacteria bacterium]|nr:site-2 protease family protein [Deltaproteobacteria bacterium]